jgi:Helix-turn-helix domain
MKDKILTESEAAALIKRGPRTMRRMRKDGRGPAYNKAPGKNGRVTYTASALLAWHRRQEGTFLPGPPVAALGTSVDVEAAK